MHYKHNEKKTYNKFIWFKEVPKGASGNAFTFLTAAVATDYIEIMALKETIKSWKIALFLPLVSVPQILFLDYILNQFS
ncbi:MAG: hypothetical protein JXQ74_00860 [Alphaproteobacteria bacterium]|nr:hypothetical protein [Alphaproteobacteria bacterium]